MTERPFAVNHEQSHPTNDRQSVVEAPAHPPAMTVEPVIAGARSMSFDERVRALEPLGFSPRQTRFLVTVALHGGFCLRRQYAAFASISYGKNVIDFLEALVSRGLARRSAQRGDRGRVYHFHSRPIYRAIGQEDNRNRRAVSAALIARKLMVLDYVLAHPDVDWLATEQDKVRLFTATFGVSLADLPQKSFLASQPQLPPTVRFFIHKMPVAAVGDPPMPAFLYLAVGNSPRAFQEFLTDHRRLFNALPSWTVIAIGQGKAPALEACERAFARFSPQSAGSEEPVSGDLLWYFERREAVDADVLASLSMADIDRYRTLRARFRAPVFDAQYRAWKSRDVGGVTSRHAASHPRGTGRGRLLIHHLPFDYSRFGSFPGVA
jgi:hypothetical protein